MEKASNGANYEPCFFPRGEGMRRGAFYFSIYFCWFSLIISSPPVAEWRNVENSQ
jgi:hypothetical protein